MQDQYSTKAAMKYILRLHVDASNVAAGETYTGSLDRPFDRIAKPCYTAHVHRTGPVELTTARFAVASTMRPYGWSCVSTKESSCKT